MKLAALAELPGKKAWLYYSTWTIHTCIILHDAVLCA